MYNIEDLLSAREKRVDFLQNLIKRYDASALVIKVNYPGLEKENMMTNRIIEIINAVVENFFRTQVSYQLKTSTAEGPICIYIIEEDAMKIKDMTMDIEEKHTLGRCVDIDVYNNTGKAISRTNFGREMRKCFICDKAAHECTRSRSHSPEEIVKYIADQYNLYLSNMYGNE